MRNLMAVLMLCCSVAWGQGNIYAPFILTSPSGGTTYTYGFDAAGYSGSSTYGASQSWSHTVTTSQGNRALFVAIHFHSATATVTSCTYNGTAMTEVGFTRSAGEEVVAIYRILNPSTGTHDVAYTLSTDGYGPIKGGSWSFTGVHQTTPNGTYAYGSSGYATPATLDISSASGDIVICAVTTDGIWFIGRGASQTTDWDITNGLVAGGEHKTATSGTTTISWTLNEADSWAVAGIAVKPN